MLATSVPKVNGSAGHFHELSRHVATGLVTFHAGETLALVAKKPFPAIAGRRKSCMALELPRKEVYVIIADLRGDLLNATAAFEKHRFGASNSLSSQPVDR
jgi:hypothetical protein